MCKIEINNNTYKPNFTEWRIYMGSSTEITDLVVKKSNQLVSSAYNSDLTSNLLILCAIGRIQERENSSGDTSLVAELYPSELKQIVSDPNHIYRELKRVNRSLMNSDAILIYDDENERFEGMHMVRHVSYENGVMTIEFESRLKQHILNLEKNYTTLELSILSSFKSNASFRLYELFKSERGLELNRRKKAGIKFPDDEVICEYGISELKFMIGLANSSSVEAKKAIDSMPHDIDWDKVYACLDSKDKKYDDYSNFRRYVLELAKKELAEKSNIRFEFEPIAKIGRKYNRIRFYTYSNVPSNPKIIDERAEYIAKKFRSVENQSEIPYDLPAYEDLFDTYVGHNGLAAEDIRMLLDDCGGDKELVKRSIIMADEQEHLYNYVGWIRNCVKNGGFEQTTVIDGSKNRAEKVSDVVDLVRNVPKNASFQERLWSRKPDDDKYFLFTRYLNKWNIDLKDFEVAYTVEERLIIYKAIINNDTQIIHDYGLPT